MAFDIFILNNSNNKKTLLISCQPPAYAYFGYKLRTLHIVFVNTMHTHLPLVSPLAQTPFSDTRSLSVNNFRFRHVIYRGMVSSSIVTFFNAVRYDLRLSTESTSHSRAIRSFHGLRFGNRGFGPYRTR